MTSFLTPLLHVVESAVSFEEEEFGLSREEEEEKEEEEENIGREVDVVDCLIMGGEWEHSLMGSSFSSSPKPPSPDAL